MAAFGEHIVQIIGLRSQEKMCWVYADAIVASVQHASAVRTFSSRDWSVVKLVTHAVRRAFEAPERHKAVSVISRHKFPRPAFSWSALIGVIPEFGGNIFRRWQDAMRYMTAGVRTELLMARLPLAWNSKSSATSGACDDRPWFARGHV